MSDVINYEFLQNRCYDLSNYLKTKNISFNLSYFLSYFGYFKMSYYNSIEIKLKNTNFVNNGVSLDVYFSNNSICSLNLWKYTGEHYFKKYDLSYDFVKSDDFFNFAYLKICEFFNINIVHYEQLSLF